MKSTPGLSCKLGSDTVAEVSGECPMLVANWGKFDVCSHLERARQVIDIYMGWSQIGVVAKAAHTSISAHLTVPQELMENFTPLLSLAPSSPVWKSRQHVSYHLF